MAPVIFSEEATDPMRPFNSLNVAIYRATEFKIIV
jgi:hypothetical protein